MRQVPFRDMKDEQAQALAERIAAAAALRTRVKEELATRQRPDGQPQTR